MGATSINNEVFSSSVPTVTATTSFQHNLESFVSTLAISDKGKNDVRREVVKLILTIQDKMGATVLRTMMRDIEGFDYFEDFVHWKKMYLDVSAYIQRVLWREVVYFIQKKDFQGNNPQTNKDVMYCIKCLHDEDIQKVVEMKINHNLNAALDLSADSFTTGKTTQRDLYSYVRSKAQTLKYLSKYDFGIEPEDFVQEVVEELVRVNNIYNRSSGKNLDASVKLDSAIKAYIETALNNKINQVKDYWSSDSRRRVTSTHAAEYRKRANLRKLLKKEVDLEKIEKIKGELAKLEEFLRTKNHDYYSVVTPLVRNNESEDREVDAQEINPAIIIPNTTDDDIWSNDLIIDLPKRVSRCVSIIIGNHDDEFYNWVKERGMNQVIEKDLNRYFKAAMEFCGVTKEELRSNPVIIQALSTAPATRRSVYVKGADVMVQNTQTMKIHPAKLEDEREDGTIIFRLTTVKNSKEIDSAFDKKWKLISRIN